MRTPRRLVHLAALAVLVAASAVVPGQAGAAGGDARAQRERVRREQAQKAAELDVLRAEDAEVTAALRVMTAQVSSQQQALAGAEQAVRAAEAEVNAARAAEAAMAQRVDALQLALRDMAVEEFITGGRLRVSKGAFESDDLSEQARRSALADFVVGNATALSQDLRAASEDLVVARGRAESAAAAAVARRNEVDAKLSELAAARDQQATFAAELDERIESRLAESAALATLDSRLSAEIARQQAALARATGGRGSGRTVSVGNVRLRTVRGITVNEQIADELERLLAAAQADGITFGGGGYRDPQQQRRLREAHCPDPDRSPSTSCRPPTARPGYSMHERGLAIDFTTGGRTLSSGSPGYRWMRVNAASYGLYNLPGEPWHWSTNGN